MANPIAWWLISPSDSNACTGTFINVLTDTVVDSNLWSYDRVSGVIPAIEPLSNLGIDGTAIGSDYAFGKLVCAAIRATPKLLPGYDTGLIPNAWSGTSLTGNDGKPWNPRDGTIARICLDSGTSGTTGSGTGAYPLVQAALAADPRNVFMGFLIDFWGNEGNNDITSAMQLLFNEFRSRIPGAFRAPAYVTGVAPNRFTMTNTPDNVISASLSNLPLNLDNFQYIDCSDLIINPNNNNGWLHWGREDHVGGQRIGNSLPAFWSAGTVFNYFDLTIDNLDFHFYRSITTPGTQSGNQPSTDGGVHWKLWPIPPLWHAGATWAADTICAISPIDLFVYQCTSPVTGGVDPSLDGGVHWTKRAPFVSANITNPICNRKKACFDNTTWKFRFHWTSAPTPGNITDLAMLGNTTGLANRITFYHTPATDARQHEYRFGAAGSGIWSAPAQLLAGSIDGLTTGNSYDVQVRGKNSGGVGAWSNTATGTAS